MHSPLLETNKRRVYAIATLPQNKAHQIQKRLQRLHRIYTTLVVEFIEAIGGYYSFDDINGFIEDLGKATRQYRQHPGLMIAGHPATRRLADLYFIIDHFHEMQEIMENEEGEEDEVSNLEPAQACVRCSKEIRNTLRENLLGEA
ncbi:hypothetical protein I2I05_05140 [Hymenobacter sp. BT683]|uniref:Uncharacterized protein n=1 Tax=Hymenobacter jeongseonensis TaxID=2791027 RepID=A0ABS0IEK8_9BACT|nr:hypothetical protein [Hymenobacter jeongseonensis]MBF9236773.1 hypothetical protein [Hymenobacter jeongseonensis]